MKVNLLFISSFLIISKFFLTKSTISFTLGSNLAFLDNSFTIVSKLVNLVYLPNSSLLIKVLYRLLNDTKSMLLNLLSSNSFRVVHKLPVDIAISRIVFPSLFLILGLISLFLFNFLMILAV